jgi:cyclopropane-fatty-acyl-phospholipid synthase
MNSSLSVKDLANKSYDNKGFKPSIFYKFLVKSIFKQLANLQYGQLVLIDGDKNYLFKGKEKLDMTAEIRVLDAEFYWFIALGGSIGAGEAYINKFWETDDLTQVIQLFSVNQDVVDSMEGGLANLTAPLKKFFHWFNKNTLSGSKNNIVAHYDLGNDFFKAFLDPTMMYSSGIFNAETETMEQASTNKLKTICEQLRLNEKDHVIEIGTGWGGFAVYAAKNYGCKVTTTTISEEQYDYTQALIEKEKLTDKITLLKEDYRNLTGQFDKLVSIEMIEAVGYEYYDTYFNKCAELLKDDGELLIQSITIADQRFEQYKKDVDFIKRYIFPGGCLPSIHAISQSIVGETNLRINHIKDIGLDYAITLKKWRETFFDNIDQVESLGFNDAFIRLWKFYLCYCEGGFRERVISTVQLHMVKPMARVPFTNNNITTRTLTNQASQQDASQKAVIEEILEES